MKRNKFLKYALIAIAVMSVGASCSKTPVETVIHVTSLSLDAEEISIGEGNTYQLTATILPENASDMSIVWESENPTVATVSDAGLVTGVSEGSAVVTATSNDGNITVPCRVTVEASRKPVRPSGTGWTTTQAADGLTLYTFSGTDRISKDPQYVVVADIDTTVYQLRMFYDGASHVTSDILTLKNAVLSMNGAYETTSIFIKTDGIVRKKDLSATISSTTVPNWKNDGGVAVDKAGNVSILNTIFRTADSKGSGSYGESLDAQRTFYRGKTGSYQDVFSSAPLLIYDYEPLGTTFLPEAWGQSYLSQFDYENPYRHQGWTHPRTAIGLDCQGHLLMIVADGRYTGKAIGFSASDLTKFLVTNFDPQYALNMDGGGSTDMCVAGQGDATKHFVNHPVDSGSWTAPGERTLSSFFYVIAK